ncbi:MAG: ABC transporter substrate-binding protein [Myxococcota bacterium]
MSPRRASAAGAAAALLSLAACSNNPYPPADDTLKVRYSALPGPPKTLDPAVSYSALEHKITANVYETLLEYDYLKRPYTLMPGLARSLPEPRSLGGGRVAYRFELREGLLFQDDEAFALGGAGRTTREVEAADVAFELMRIADPQVTSPVGSTFAKIEGFRDFSARLEELRRQEEGFADLRIDRQYERAGGIAGLRVRGPHQLELVLSEPYPQLLYWFAMPFTAPVPWEAVAYYDGQEGRDFFKDHPVGVGPFKITEYEKHFRIVLERNDNWYGIQHPEWRAPGAIYPSEGTPEDAAAGLLDPSYRGRPLPFLDRIEYRIEKETIPYFNKFLQGYYDASGIIRESFDVVIHEGDLSPEMAALGMRLEKAVDPDVHYLGFNMNDPVVGTPAGEKGRKLRQAMSLAVDVQEYKRIFTNGRGVPAQSPIPPGIFGYDPDYVNPFSQLDLERGRELLSEAGYEGGIDPTTGKPLHLTFDLGDPSTRARLTYAFFVNAWRQLGLDVVLAATTYNQFRDKVNRGAYQIFSWGWIADYPDPENFLFLLWGPMAESESGGPNTANFNDPRYNELFLAMKDRENDARRLEIIRELLGILEQERPWIELLHRESYSLIQPWLRNVKPAGLSLPASKYQDVDAGRRAALRARWNDPVVWPAYALGVAAVALVVPGILTFLRERQ